MKNASTKTFHLTPKKQQFAFIFLSARQARRQLESLSDKETGTIYQPEGTHLI